MWREYKETFDGVHASQRLKTEVLNMKREEHAEKKRRVPAAALVAAALAAVLAGTALAAEYFGWVRIGPISNWLGPDGQPEDGGGYGIAYETGRFPAENLSEEVFAIGQEIGDVHIPRRMIAFNSWAACEEFLDVELANNPRLDQMQKKTVRVEGADGGLGDVYAYVSLTYAELMPSYVSATAYYGEGPYISGWQHVQLCTQYAPDGDPEYWDVRIPQNGEEPLTCETYITAGGTEAAIFTDTYDAANSTYTDCYASFVKDHMRFGLGVSVRTHAYQEPTGAPDALELIKEILDAYE